MSFRRVFIVTDTITLEPVTILVEAVGSQDAEAAEVAIKTLDGEYGVALDFERALSDAVDVSRHSGGKAWSFLPMKVSSVRMLRDVLGEALEAAEASPHVGGNAERIA